MKLPIKFEVLKEDGLPHMKTYITKCTVGTYNATGEGNGKKVIFLFSHFFLSRTIIDTLYLLSIAIIQTIILIN